MRAASGAFLAAILVATTFAGGALAQIHLQPQQRPPQLRQQQQPQQPQPQQQQTPQPTPQQSQAWEWCRNQGGGVSPDLRVSGCTTVIQSGRENQRSLAFAFNSRGNAYLDKKDLDRAIADYDQAIKLNPNDAVFYSNRAMASAKKGQIDRAFVDFDQSIRINPNLARVYYERGHIYRNKKLFDLAIADFDQAIRIDQKYAFAYAGRGNAYYGKKEYDRAIADYDQATRLNPNYAFAYNSRGHANYAKKDYDRAIADYDQAIRLAPNEAIIYVSRANAFFAKKDYDRAIADFDQAIRLNPNEAMIYNSRGNSHAAKKDYDRAITDFSQAIRLSPNLARAFIGRGNAYSNKGDYERALADFDQVIRIEPGAFAYVGRCLARTIVGQAQQAMADCNEGVKLAPNDAPPWSTRGFVHYKLGALDNAIADYDAALKIDPRRAQSLYGRGLAKQRNGDTAGGNADIAAAIAIRGDIAELFARYGEDTAPETTPVVTSSIASGADSNAIQSVNHGPTGDFRRRVALVIGNSNYAGLPLRNPSHDAADIGAALRKLGFEVVIGIDLNRRGLDDVIRDFGRKLEGADLALFFYAGHGLQVNGRNYLVPIDAKLERPGDLALDTVDIGVVLAQMEAEKRVNLVVLDACRDNPFARSLARSLGTRSGNVGTGLATIQSAIGTLIAFATQPDDVAQDGQGRNSPFTAALLKHIGTPRVDISTVMRRVRADVIAATREKQVPWDHSSLIGEVILVQ